MYVVIIRYGSAHWVPLRGPFCHGQFGSEVYEVYEVYEVHEVYIEGLAWGVSEAFGAPLA